LSDIIVVRKKPDLYIATQNGRKIAEGETQNEAGLNAQARRPNDPILAQRVRDTDNGVRDEFRRLYPKKD